MTSYIVELEDYKGEHQASGKDGAPLYDLTMNGVYPDDVYSINGLQYYGTGHQDNLDREALNIIRNSYNKPNKKVKIYRILFSNTNLILFHMLSLRKINYKMLQMQKNYG